MGDGTGVDGMRGALVPEPAAAQTSPEDRLDLLEAVPDRRARLTAIIDLCRHSAAAGWDLVDPIAVVDGCQIHAERALALLEAAV